MSGSVQYYSKLVGSTRTVTSCRSLLYDQLDHPTSTAPASRSRPVTRPARSDIFFCFQGVSTNSPGLFLIPSSGSVGSERDRQTRTDQGTDNKLRAADRVAGGSYVFFSFPSSTRKKSPLILLPCHPCLISRPFVCPHPPRSLALTSLLFGALPST